MKKLLLITFLGLTLFSCSKEELDLKEQQIVEMNVHLENCATLAGPDASVDLTVAQIQLKYNSLSKLRNLYSSLLGSGVSTTAGKWSPSIEELAARYTNSTDKFGAYTSTYTVINGDCTDSADISVNVVPECNVNAGADNVNSVFTLSEFQATFTSVSKVKNFYTDLIQDGVATNGTFTPTIEDLAARYMNAEDKTGVYSTTYTVGSGNCIDTAELSLSIVADRDDTVCTISAGKDNTSTILTVAQIQSRYNSLSRIRTLYYSLLESGVPTTGTFNPTIEELAAQFSDAGDKAGVYSTTYTVVEGNCSDSSIISITVVN